MTDCSEIMDCITCITSVLQCFFVLTGVGIEEKWKCVSSLAGMHNVRMTVMEDTREFCAPSQPSTTTTGNEIVTYMSFALSVFCLIGICATAYWARKDRRRRSSPPPRPPQPNQTARMALSSLTTFARRCQEERERSRAIFDQRNTAFQRELAERLERVRFERAAAYPETPRNTPEASSQPSGRSRQSLPPISTRSSRAVSIQPPSRGSLAWSSRATTPIPPSRQHVSLSREQTPDIPENLVPIQPTSGLNDNTYDSPASTIYESIENSPQATTPPVPPHQEQHFLSNDPPLPSPPRSSYGRLLKRTSFFKCNP